MAALPDLTRLLLDPVIARAVGAALSIVFLLGAGAKLRDLPLFRASVEGYQLLPEPLLPMATLALPLWELGCGLALLLAPHEAATLLASAGLLATVTGAVAINLLRGRRDVDCGCAGLSDAAGGQRIGWGLVARNAVLLAGLASLAGEAQARAYTWVDDLSLLGTTLALLGLYAAANQLLSNHPRLLAIKRS